MIRRLSVGLVVYVSLALSGLAAVAGDTACDGEDCPADSSGGECAPNCHFCTCCSLPRVAGNETSKEAPLPAVVRTDLISGSELPPAPEPADILHVPKALLA